MVLCAEKAEPVTIDRDVGFAGPDQACGLLSALSLWQQPAYVGRRPLARWLLAPGIFALGLQGSALYAVHAGVLHRYSSNPLQILENRSGETAVGQEGKAGKVPVSLLVLGCCRMGAAEVAGERRGRV